MMPVLSVTGTMEGPKIWQIQSLPVSPKLWLGSRFLWGLTPMLCSYLPSQMFLSSLCRPSLPKLLWQMGILLAMMMFSCWSGLWADLRFHRFDYDQEATAVKQSLSAFVGGFGGVLGCLLCTAVLLLLHCSVPAQIGVWTAVVATTGLLARRSLRTRMELL